MSMNLEQQNFDVPQERKEIYGEISTDFNIINQMLEQLPEELFQNPNIRWLDVGAGQGYFTKALFNKLYISLVPSFPDSNARRTHILTKMLYMIEINEFHAPKLLSTFGKEANIIIQDFLSHQPEHAYDVIIGNPPYNSHGMIKVPSNNERDKREDGRTVWPLFIRHAVSLVAPSGYLNFITPSIWLRPDKAKTYDYIHTLKLLNVKCFSASETSKAFHGHAQTPTCMFTLQNMNNVNQERTIMLYDHIHENYISYQYCIGEPIPLFSISIIKKIRSYVMKYGYPTVNKTNLPPRDVKLSSNKDDNFCYANIKTCILNNNEPKLVIEYSNKKLKYQGEKKLVLAHKMYGFPYDDTEGIYGISNRDNYVMIISNDTERKYWQEFLSTRLVLFIFEAARYRMRYLEKEAFMWLPNIVNIPNFPKVITDETLAAFFELTELEKKYVLTFHKNYKKLKI